MLIRRAIEEARAPEQAERSEAVSEWCKIESAVSNHEVKLGARHAGDGHPSISKGRAKPGFLYSKHWTRAPRGKADILLNSEEGLNMTPERTSRESVALDHEALAPVTLSFTLPKIASIRRIN